MEPVDRVRAALALEVADRPPAAWWGHTFREEWSPSELAAVTVARQRRFGWDFVKLQPRATCFAEAFGSVYRPSGDPLKAPILVQPGVLDFDDWRRLPAADAGAPALGDQVEALRRVASELGPSVPVIQTVFSPLTVARYLVGEDPDRTVRELRQRPDLVGEALGRVAGALSDLTRRSVEAGAAGIFYAISGYASADTMSLDEYERVVLPTDRRVVDAIPDEAWFNVLHLCGPNQYFGLAQALGLHAVSWSIHERGNPTLVEARTSSGRAVMGGLDREALVSGSRDEVLREGRDAVSATRGNGLLLAPGCSVPPEAPEANLTAVRAAVSGRR